MNYRKLAFLPDDLPLQVGPSKRALPASPAKPDRKINYLVQRTGTPPTITRQNGFRVRGQTLFARNADDRECTHLPTGYKTSTIKKWYDCLDADPKGMDKLVTEKAAGFVQDVQEGWV